MMHEKRGMVCLLLAGTMFLASLAAARGEDKFSAGEMQASCQSIVEAVKTAKNPDELELDNTFTAGVCWGAFQSIQQIIVTKVEGRKTTILQICAPEEATLVQLIQIFDLFVRSNPKRQDEPFTKVAIAALRSAFPCRQGAL